MGYRPGDPYEDGFTTSNPVSGAAQNADATPTVTVLRNGVADPSFALTLTNPSAGQYDIKGTVPSGYVRADTVQVYVVATVAGITGKEYTDKFPVEVPDKSGYKLASDGFDTIIVEPAAGPVGAINARQSLALIMDASPVGGLTGVTSNTIHVQNPGSTVSRAVVTVDADGNRTVPPVLNLP